MNPAGGARRRSQGPRLQPRTLQDAKISVGGRRGGGRGGSPAGVAGVVGGSPASEVGICDRICVDCHLVRMGKTLVRVCDADHGRLKRHLRGWFGFRLGAGSLGLLGRAPSRPASSRRRRSPALLRGRINDWPGTRRLAGTHLAKYRVLAVEMGLLGVRDEELRLVRVCARVGHREDAAVVELE